ncbi:hypothetical protein [Bacteroides acidifaciens]|jgi:hypothetical protein|uniref:hypothetical protein n=1 Tax=Bacteroides acidifaciens TaxID=85831 RepID=UPI000F46A79F|nr:hypothetical protein [Bacteroides acidifaciens]ROT16585.1 hypothetical protein EEL51_13430 [Muribaculaceae bacterium Isolate-110 (HZI)]
MKESLHSVLERSFAPYLPLTDRKNLSLKEQQTLYKLDFGKRRKCVSYQIDGNIIKTGNKCDFLILAKQEEDENNNNWKAIFVELKGTDVEHALKQLDATMSNSIFSHGSIDEKHARIVAKSFPSSKSNPKFELEKRKFKAKHKCSLKQVSTGNIDIIT